MSAREDLIYRITRHCSAETAEQMVDAYRAEVLAEQEKATAPAAMATPHFLQVGRTYRSPHTGFTAPELITTFRVEHVTRHPDRGHLRAIGWSRTGEPGAGWHGDFLDEEDIDGWTDVTDISRKDATS